MFESMVSNVEFEGLLVGVARRYGVDLTGYSRISLMRRVSHFTKKSGIQFSELKPRVLGDQSFFQRFLNDISVSVTEFFRDPPVFFTVVKRVLPYLAHLPYLKIWHAGCATGQEVFSLAILLHEAKLLSRSTIYATDINHNSILTARQGIYEKKELLRSASSYKKSGGLYDLSDYYTEKYEHIRFCRFLRNRIAFAEHELVSQATLAEINVLFCRNVFIYFDRELQKKVIKKFSDSVVPGGFLVLGTSESLQFVDDQSSFENYFLPHRIYRRKS